MLLPLFLKLLSRHASPSAWADDRHFLLVSLRCGSPYISDNRDNPAATRTSSQHSPFLPLRIFLYLLCTTAPRLFSSCSICLSCL